SRVYSPSSIPDQSGTRVGGQLTNKFANLRTVPPPSVTETLDQRPPTLPPPPPEATRAPPRERAALIEARLAKADSAFRKEYEQNFLMSCIYHDSALDGVVYTYDELRTGINPDITVVPDSSLQSVCDSIRRHRDAIRLVQDLGQKKRQP